MTRFDKLYLGLCILFCSFLMLGNLTYQKFVGIIIPHFHQFELSVGAIIYPITFILMDLMAEFYGRERAKWCIRFAMFNNFIIAMVVGFMDALPATSWSKVSDEAFHQVFGFYLIALTGSLLACYISQRIDVVIYLWIKKITKERFLWLRNNVSTGISLFFDTCIAIGFLTYFNVLQVENMQTLIFNSYSWKLFFTVMCTPLFYLLVYLIRSRILVPKVLAA
jgi:queuosine precursor transporter